MASVSVIERQIPLRTNICLVVLACSLNVFQYWIFPLYFLDKPFIWSALLLPGIILTNGYWALVHEGIHGNLHPNKQVNDRLARVICILFGSSLRILRAGHLLHHRFSRSERERLEIYSHRKTSRFAANADYFFQLVGGLYLMEILGGLCLLLPLRGIEKLAAFLDTPGRLSAATLRTAIASADSLRQARVDALCVLLVLSSAFHLYAGEGWVLAGALFCRGFLISVADYIYHYATPLGDPKHGLNAVAPKWLQVMLLNFNLHGIHHRYPMLPWNALPLHLSSTDEYGGSWSGLIIRQFRGPRWSDE